MSRINGPTAAIGGSWAKLNPPLSPWILDVIHDMGFTNMTPVQAGTIPRAVKNQDCVVEAVTGSGKTLAYLVPVLERLARSERKYGRGEVAAIVIAPTRELASQIYDIFHLFLASLIPKPIEPSSPIASSSRSPSPPPQTADPLEAPYSLPCLITSGTVNPHDTFLSLSSNILIGTPGRLASFLLSPRGEGVVKVGDLDCLVLDEADKLLSSPDHRRDVERIMRYLPKQRRTHLFSATMTDAVEEMVGLGLRNPVRIVVNLKDKRTGEEAKERRTPMALQNNYIVCRHAEKTLQLVRLLQHEAQQHEAAKFIVYFSTCAAVDYFYRILSAVPALQDFALTSLHGDLPPRVRSTALSSFTSHPSTYLNPAVLLCTDVASRGVDFADVDVVIQYDPPMDPKTFSHRAGRTARAGRRGKAVVLLGKGREEEYVDFLAARKIPVAPQGKIGADLMEVTSEGSRPAVEGEALSLMADIRKNLSNDRDLNDRAAKAFVSALRAYTKHEASFIFRVADVDFADWATSYGLLRLPAMPEVKDWRRRVAARKVADAKRVEAGETVEPANELEWQDAEIDWDNFAYTDKKRETARLEALAAKRAAAASRPTSTPASSAADGGIDTSDKKRKIKAEMREAWSEQKDKKAKREEARMKRDKKKQAIWESRMGEEELGMVEKFKREQAIAGGQQVRKVVAKEDREEWDKEYKQLKKEMKGEKGRKVDKAPAVASMFGDLD